MDTVGSSKDDLLGQIWSISTTLTEEAMKLASSKAEQAGFDLNRGLIPLTESFINLSSARVVLEDAIEKQKLIQLPITVQKEILTYLENIAKSLKGLGDGVDEVVTLTAAIEALNTAIWKYGLHNLSDQVLGYQKKLNQLKNEEVRLANILRDLETARDQAAKVLSMVADSANKQAEIAESLKVSKEAEGAAASQLEKLNDTANKANALLATVQQNEKLSGELTAAIKTANNELMSLDVSIRKFYGEIDEYRRKVSQTTEEAAKLIGDTDESIKRLIEETTNQTTSTIQALQDSATDQERSLTAKVESLIERATTSIESTKTEQESQVATFRDDVQEKLQQTLANFTESVEKSATDSREFLDGLSKDMAKRSSETIEANAQKTSEMIEELTKLKEQIREQIEQATGFSLFGAFQARQNEIARSKNMWVYAIASLVFISAGVTAWIAHEAQSYNTHSFAFWVKLSLTVPLGYALTFCTLQYSRERRLEEEYAFKSSISVSLNPYRDLVHSILEKDGAVDKSKYTDFVIESVTKVFTSPTERVFEAEHRGEFTKKTFKDVAEVIGTAAKAAK